MNSEKGSQEYTMLSSPQETLTSTSSYDSHATLYYRPLAPSAGSRRYQLTKREKRRRDEAPMPAASAGLLRFFEEDTPGIKLSPQLVVISGVGLVVLALIARPDALV